MDDKLDLTPIPSQTVGPFFHLGCTDRHSCAKLVSANTRGERIKLIFQLLDANDAPVPDGMIEIWQANAGGKYAHPEDTQDKPLDSGFTGFGRAATDASGKAMFETIRPGPVPDASGNVQAPHINISVLGRGLLQRLATRAYFSDDPTNANDPVLSLVPPDRRTSLLAQPSSGHQTEWTLTIHLSGEHETVFFDV